MKLYFFIIQGNTELSSPIVIVHNSHILNQSSPLIA